MASAPSSAVAVTRSRRRCCDVFTKTQASLVDVQRFAAVSASGVLMPTCRTSRRVAAIFRAMLVARDTYAWSVVLRSLTPCSRMISSFGMSGSCSRGHVGSFATLAAVVAGLGSACVASTGHSPAPSVVDPGRSVVADACLDCHSEVGHAGKPDLSRGLSPELALRALRMVAMGDMPPPSVSTLTTQARGAVIGYLCRSSEYGASYCAIAEAGWAARPCP